ncbi:MAG: 16S rRNA processing protein RimM [Alphaproteobacteria bacterium]|nr:16S rRNA processing protein RimM [Alphaproteobacteria bacterium]MBL0718062.1 16S rRNA processing protein RimM [Alphaproteobacteria bacterium]
MVSINKDTVLNATTGDTICVGKIVKSHGLKGNFVIDVYLDESKQIKEFQKLQLEDGKVISNLEVISIMGRNRVLAKLSDVDNIDGIQYLLQKNLYIYRDELPKLSLDSFYVNDLIGLKVFSTDLRATDDIKHILGTVYDVINHGASDILEITGVDGSSKKIFIPFIEKAIVEVNLEEKFVIIDSEFVLD